MAVLLAGCPPGINVFLFARTYGAGEASSASAIVIGSLLSLGSLWIILYLFDHLLV